MLQSKLGLGKHVAAFDVNLGCSGFVYGLSVADSFIRSEAARNVLLINSDTYTKLIHPRDRTTRTLFGDAAAATLVSRATGGPGQIGPFVLGTDGEGEKDLIVPSGGFRTPRSSETAEEVVDESGSVRSRDNLFMNGKAVFVFALTVVPQVIAEALEKASLSAGQIDWYIYHQANKFMLENLALRSRIPRAKMLFYMEDVGNTVSASIPLAIQAYVETGQILPGQRLLLIGFGVGYSWGVCVVTWG